MELPLRQIANKIPLYFKSGDPDILKKLLFKDDNTFLRFSGNDQYCRKVKRYIPNIDLDLLLIDYDTSRSLIMAGKYYLRDVYANGSDPKKLLIRFEYGAVNTDYALIEYSEQFKVLDRIIRPLTDSFWNIYLPPNFIGDGSSFRVILYGDITELPLDLPIVDKDFILDRNEVFLSDLPERKEESLNDLKSEQDYLTSINIASDKYGIDFNRLIQEAIDEVYGKDPKADDFKDHLKID
uniref:hypothetical protein n=1 Tax=uncultured Dysgonomonas sp. TaxID=206096 RepID=UPI002625CDB3|nr:hypothetical protein [uncultured Dysgonomonas sp.]